MRVALPYGARGYPIELPEREVEVLRAAALGAPPPLAKLLHNALSNPVGAALSAPAGSRVTVIVSDDTRHEPRAAFIDVIHAQLPAVRWTVAIDTGTHGPTTVDALGLPAVLNKIGAEERGLLLVTGATGSGKSRGDLYLAAARANERLVVATQWDVLILFLAVFVLCAGLTVWAVVRAVKDRPGPGEAAA